MQISSSPYPYLSREHIASEMGFKFNDINEILDNNMGYGMSFPMIVTFASSPFVKPDSGYICLS